MLALCMFARINCFVIIGRLGSVTVITDATADVPEEKYCLRDVQLLV